MDLAYNHVKLQTLVCEMEGYYGSDSSLPSSKGAFQSKTKVESSKIIAMPITTIGTC